MICSVVDKDNVEPIEGADDGPGFRYKPPILRSDKTIRSSKINKDELYFWHWHGNYNAN